MDENGRRTRWGVQIQYLFGREFYNHVIYYDVVGASFSGKLLTVVITDTDLYIYNLNQKKRPEPFCKLSEITEIDSDHEAPKTFLNHPQYDPHRIIIKLRGEYHALYTFQTGSDLYWRLSNAVENSKRHSLSQCADEPSKDANLIKVKSVDGITYTLQNTYVKRFNRIASHVLHDTSLESRIKSLEELDEISNEYFPIRIIFFQSSILVQNLMDTLSFLSDFHTVPPQITTDRVQQISLIKAVLETFLYYLRGSTSVLEALRLISFNKAEHYKSLLSSLFNIEIYVLSQPQRAQFFLKSIIDKDAYLNELQSIEMTIPSLAYTLYGLNNTAMRSLSDASTNDIFLEIFKQKKDLIISGTFHTIAYMTVQLAYLLKNDDDLPGSFPYTFLDHLWFLSYVAGVFPEAAQMLKDNYEVDINVILTEERISPDLFPAFPLYEDLIENLRNVKAIMKKVPARRGKMANLPAQFK